MQRENLKIVLKPGFQIMPAMRSIFVNYLLRAARTGVAVGSYSAKLKNGKNSLPRILFFTLQNLEVCVLGSDLGG
jgi:hypothetical protein